MLDLLLAHPSIDLNIIDGAGLSFINHASNLNDQEIQRMIVTANLKRHQADLEKMKPDLSSMVQTQSTAGSAIINMTYHKENDRRQVMAQQFEEALEKNMELEDAGKKSYK